MVTSTGLPAYKHLFFTKIIIKIDFNFINTSANDGNAGLYFKSIDSVINCQLILHKKKIICNIFLD